MNSYSVKVIWRCRWNNQCLTGEIIIFHTFPGSMVMSAKSDATRLLVDGFVTDGSTGNQRHLLSYSVRKMKFVGCLLMSFETSLYILYIYCSMGVIILHYLSYLYTYSGKLLRRMKLACFTRSQFMHQTIKS